MIRNGSRLFRLAPLAALATLGWGLASFGGELPERVDFNFHIRGILSDRCYKCHGPDENTREAGLRLDTFADATRQSAKGKAAIVPAAPEHSDLVRRIFTTDADDLMPPRDAGVAPLTEREKGLLRKWIEQGAEYKNHWSFIPIQRPQLPAGADPGWPLNGIDFFTREKMRDAGLTPSPEASRLIWLKRVSFDLNGLPPTPREIDGFLSDASANAYEKVVDRLLASPRYGEHMALPWLDAARYADTSGYQADWERFMWPWRNWVIDAFNRNLPFDQFTIEQIAGDLLPNPTPDQIIATGFNRNHRINDEGGVIAAEYAVEYVVDRIDTTCTTWLGLTMGCARCHDHKYDPLTMDDFYNLFAVFNNVPEKGKDGRLGYAEPTVDFVDPEMESRLKPMRARKTALQAELHRSGPEIAAARRTWIARSREKLSQDTGATTWSVLDPTDVSATGGVELKRQKGTPLFAAEVATALKAAARTSEQDALLDEQFRRADPLFSPIRKQLASLDEEISALEKKRMIKVMVMKEMETPRDTYLLKRGQYDQPDTERKMSPNIPRVFGDLSGKSRPNRLGFAKWLIARDNPLTARVTVNRYWQRYFGKGLVATVEDFGTQGSLPTHPELLDWLAAEFMDSGWDVKAMQKLIVMSATYRQSSKVDAQLLELDPENKLYARGPRFRLSAHELRDQALALSGKLSDRIGGPSVRPYQPPGLWSDVSFQSKARSTDFYVPDTGHKLYRRSLYTFWKRSVAPPQMMTFDAAGREACVVRMTRTSTPLQALTLLNDTTFVEAARGLAQRMMLDGGKTPEDRIAFGLKLAAAEPNEKTVAILRRGYDDYRASFLANPENAEELLATGESRRDKSLPFIDLAAYTMVASTILNLDQTITKE